MTSKLFRNISWYLLLAGFVFAVPGCGGADEDGGPSGSGILTGSWKGTIIDYQVEDMITHQPGRITVSFTLSHDADTNIVTSDTADGTYNPSTRTLSMVSRTGVHHQAIYVLDSSGNVLTLNERYRKGSIFRQ